MAFYCSSLFLFFFFAFSSSVLAASGVMHHFHRQPLFVASRMGFCRIERIEMDPQSTLAEQNSLYYIIRNRKEEIDNGRSCRTNASANDVTGRSTKGHRVKARWPQSFQWLYLCVQVFDSSFFLNFSPSTLHVSEPAEEALLPPKWIRNPIFKRCERNNAVVSGVTRVSELGGGADLPYSPSWLLQC